jgi:hypothetical protein
MGLVVGMATMGYAYIVLRMRMRDDKLSEY